MRNRRPEISYTCTLSLSPLYSRELYPHAGKPTFVLENCVREYLKVREIGILKRPVQSLDLNTIEIVWDELGWTELKTVNKKLGKSGSECDRELYTKNPSEDASCNLGTWWKYQLLILPLKSIFLNQNLFCVNMNKSH